MISGFKDNEQKYSDFYSYQRFKKNFLTGGFKESKSKDIHICIFFFATDSNSY